MGYLGTLLICLFAFIRIQARYTCDELFTGQVTPPPDCSHGHDRAEIDPYCRIDLAVNSNSDVVLTALRKAYHSNVKLCFGCPEHDFYGQCNTVIACHPQTVCYNETHRDKEHNTRHMYGCIWESDNIHINGHHCSQSNHGSNSGTVTCNDAKLCNGNAQHIHHIANLMKTTQSPTTTPELTTVPTTPEMVTTTPEMVTTTPEMVTTTPEMVTTTPEMVTTTPEMLTTTPEMLTTTPEMVTTTPQLTTTPTLTSTPQPTTTKTARPMEELSTTAKTTFMTEQSTAVKSTSAAPMTSTSNAASTDGVTHTQLIKTTVTPTSPIPCQQGNGTLMCMDHDDPPNFVCETFDNDLGFCGWTASGHDRAVSQCPVYCGFCDEYCKKQYQAQIDQTTTSSAPTTMKSTSPPASDRSCMVCGSEDDGLSCSPRQTYYNSSHQCSLGNSYCMTSVYVDENGATNVYKRCVDEMTCLNKWLLFSSDNDYCLHYGAVSIAGKYECHFCCTADNCNADVYPSSHMYVG